MSRYRVNPSVFLPKFVSPKNPFLRSQHADPVAQATVCGGEAECAPRPSAKAPLSNDVPGRTARATFMRRVCGWISERMGRLNPARLTRWRSGRVKPATRRPVGERIQGELSLDHVKVVRNDLRDADLEVVAVGGGRRFEKSPPAESALDRLATRIFETENSVM
jgi:hypothetical protein